MERWKDGRKEGKMEGRAHFVSQDEGVDVANGYGGQADVDEDLASPV